MHGGIFGVSRQSQKFDPSALRIIEQTELNSSSSSQIITPAVSLYFSIKQQIVLDDSTVSPSGKIEIFLGGNSKSNCRLFSVRGGELPSKLH
jgi:hypothetical protein